MCEEYEYEDELDDDDESTFEEDDDDFNEDDCNQDCDYWIDVMRRF